MCSCIDVLSNTTPKARKQYTCDSSTIIRDLLQEIECGEIKLSFSERRAILEARNKHWKILPGETYLCQRNIMDGYIYSFRSIPAIHAICLKHNLYVCDC